MQRLGRLAPTDEEPVFPLICVSIVRIFFELHAARPSGFGMSPITYHDIDAYARLMHVKLSPWDVRMLRRMDEVMLKASRIAQENKSKNG